MKSFAAATLLAVASAQFSDVTHPENTRVDLDNSTKFIGRIGVVENFDEWVDERVIDGALLNVDQNPCLYQWICADGVNKPFAFSDDEALYINHNCPLSLVSKMRFTTVLQTDNVLEYHNDDTVRRVDESVEGQTTVTSWIGEKLPLAEGETEYPLGNDDGFLFDGAEPAWSYAYDICLAGDDLSSEFCSRTEAPIDGGDDPVDPVDSEDPVPVLPCGYTPEQIQPLAFSADFSGDFADYTIECLDIPLEFSASGQAGVKLGELTAYYGEFIQGVGVPIQGVGVQIVNSLGATLVAELGAFSDDSETKNFGLAYDYATYVEQVGDEQIITGVSSYTGDVAEVTLGSLAFQIEFYVPDISYGLKQIVFAVKKSDGELAAFAPQFY